MVQVLKRQLGMLVACVAASWFAPASFGQDYGGYPDPVTNPLSGLMLDLPGTGTDPTAINYNALPKLPGAYSLISQGDETWQFRLHNYITWYDNKYWMMWSHGPLVEDKDNQHVRFVTSLDGVNWSPEENIVGPADQDGFRYIARGFWQREGELFALASYDEVGGYFGDSLELRAFRWDATEQRWDPAGVVADDTINNFEPKMLPTGKWMMSRRGDDYATNPADRSWLIGGVNSISDWQNSPIPVAANGAKLEEPVFYELPDGNLVSLYRDNSNSKRLYRSFSSDDGQSWSQPVPTNFPDATAKFYDLKTSRGYYVLVSNANPAGRNPLTLSISQDGLVYTQMAVLDIPGTGTFQYPHAIEHNGEILIPFSRDKRSIELFRVSLDSIDAILDYVPEPPQYSGLLNGDFEDLSGTFPTGWTVPAGREPPTQHAGLGGSTTAALFTPNDRITQSLAVAPGPEWELDLLFAMEDPGDSAARGLNLILNNEPNNGNLNLRVNGDGSVQTVTSTPSTTWVDVPNLSSAVQFSVDANNDGDFSDVGDVLNVYRMVLRGNYTTESPEYTVLLSQANQTELALSGTTNLWFGGRPAAGSSISSVSISAQMSGGDYLVDQVFLRMLGATPGDYNGDGAVDAADYVVWRKDPAAFGGPDGFETWRSNFGNSSGGGSSVIADSTVPEPTNLAAVVIAASILGRYRGLQTHRRRLSSSRCTR
jgi:hypothetical protein